MLAYIRRTRETLLALPSQVQMILQFFCTAMLFIHPTLLMLRGYLVEHSEKYHALLAQIKAMPETQSTQMLIDICQSLGTFKASAILIDLSVLFSGVCAILCLAIVVLMFQKEPKQKLVPVEN